MERNAEVKKKPGDQYRIGILSDTHGSVPADIYQKFDGVDAILHAGDLGSSDVLLDLEVIAPVYAVTGNIDFFHYRPSLPQQRIISIGPLTFGILHGHQFERSNLEAGLIRHFEKAGVDVIVFGHTHSYFVKKVGHLWLVNPGASHCRYSPTGIRATFTSADDLVFEQLHFCESNEEDFDYDFNDDT